MFSILLPSFGRPERAKILLRSILETQTYDNEISFYIQNDDPLVKNYEEVFKFFNHKEYVVEPHYTTTIMWNILADRAKHDYFILMGDDVEFKTREWDLKTSKHCLLYEDNIFVAGAVERSLDSLIHTGFQVHSKMITDWLTCHPILHRTLKESLGYFAPPCFQHGYIDVWLCYLAQALGRWIWMNDVRFEHLLKNKRLYDNTYHMIQSSKFDDSYLLKRCERWWRSDLELLNKLLPTPLTNSEIQYNLDSNLKDKCQYYNTFFGLE